MRILVALSVLLIGNFLLLILADPTIPQPIEGYVHGLLYGHSNDSNSNKTIFERVTERLVPVRERNFTLNVPDLLDRARERISRRMDSFRERLTERLQNRRKRFQRHFSEKIDRWIEIIDQHNERSGDETNRSSFAGLKKWLKSFRERLAGAADKSIDRLDNNASEKPPRMVISDEGVAPKELRSKDNEQVGKKKESKGLNVV